MWISIKQNNSSSTLNLEVGSLRNFEVYSKKIYLSIYEYIWDLSICQIESLISNVTFGNIILEGNRILLDSAKPCSLSALLIFYRCVFCCSNILTRFYVVSYNSVYASSITGKLKKFLCDLQSKTFSVLDTVLTDPLIFYN